jgi:hypothetical protein
MMSLAHVSVRPVRIGLALLACLGLAACFDYEQDLTIRGSGAGTLQVSISTDPAYKDSLGNDAAIGDQAAQVETKTEMRDGRFVQVETASFNKLSDLELANQTLSIINNGAWLWGIGPKDLTFTGEVDNSGADPTALGVVQAMFADHSFTYKVTLPGWVTKAYPLSIGGKEIKPVQNGTTITWTVPMARALTTRKLVYKADFLAFMDVPGNVTSTETKASRPSLPGAEAP